MIAPTSRSDRLQRNLWELASTGMSTLVALFIPSDLLKYSQIGGIDRMQVHAKVQWISISRRVIAHSCAWSAPFTHRRNVGGGGLGWMGVYDAEPD